MSIFTKESALQVFLRTRTESSQFSPKSKSVSCELDTNFEWNHIGKQRTCFLRTKTIGSFGFTILSQNELVTGLDFWKNKNISYLPEKVDDNFPNLQGIDAGFCSVKAISKTNFQGLSKLKLLWLYYNQIEQIADDTFDDLVSLEKISLGKIYIIILA